MFTQEQKTFIVKSYFLNGCLVESAGYIQLMLVGKIILPNNANESIKICSAILFYI